MKPNVWTQALCESGACVQIMWRSRCETGDCVQVGRCEGASCVEVAACCGNYLIRDSKLGDNSPVLSFTPAEWEAFKAGVRAGDFDDD